MSVDAPSFGWITAFLACLLEIAALRMIPAVEVLSKDLFEQRRMRCHCSPSVTIIDCRKNQPNTFLKTSLLVKKRLFVASTPFINSGSQVIIVGEAGIAMYTVIELHSS